MSVSEIIKKYDISKVTVYKHCKNCNIELPSQK